MHAADLFQPLAPPRSLHATRVAEHLAAARQRVVALTGDLGGAQMLGPKLAIVNPVLWEFGHVACFQEHWCLRMQRDGTRSPSVLAGADELYDSTAIPHDVRWDLPLPDREAARRYVTEVLEQVLEALDRRPEDQRLLYFAELSACHEDMHAEAVQYTCETLGHGPPALAMSDTPGAAHNVSGDSEFAGGSFLPYPGFVPDPYKEYSAPWFGTRTVLRGGSFATPTRLMRNPWRNFFTPDRHDVFAGFRTCALAD